MNLVYSILGVFGYLIVGLGWAIFHWIRFYDDELFYYETERAKFLKFHGIYVRSERKFKSLETVPEYLQYEWRDVVLKNDRLQSIPPEIHQYRSEIAFDIILWWLSILAMGVQKLFDVVMKYIMNHYNRVTQRRLKSISKDSKHVTIDKELNKKQ